ncbi:AfsR/SARP family transcriptional regulator [Microbispora siamensis]
MTEEIDPDGALSAHALQSQVSRLRTALGPAAAIERSGPGYRIVVADDDVDACRFERLAGLLMRALSAEGGQAEALVVFEETRRHLSEELGADPSAELVALHRELMSADPSPSPAAPPA